MIGSLLFYGLYPLTRYFSKRASAAAEASKKKTLPAALVNGKELVDLVYVSTRECQTALRDQQLHPNGGTCGQTREWLKEKVPEKDAIRPETRPEMDEEPLKVVAVSETNAYELVLKVESTGEGFNQQVPQQDIIRPDMYEEQLNVDVWKQTVSEEDIIRPEAQGEQLKVEVLKRQVAEEDTRPEAEGEQLKVAVMKQQVPEDDIPKPEEDGEQLYVPVLKEQVLEEDERSEMDGGLLKVAAGDKTKNEHVLDNAGVLQSTVVPEEEEMSSENLKDEAEASQQEDHALCVHHDEMNMKEETVALDEMISPLTQLQNQSSESIRVEEICPMLEKIAIPSMEESLSLGKAATAGKECWDEYITDAGEINYDTICPPLDLVSLLSEFQTQPRKTLHHVPQPGWHNPEDPGLAEAGHYVSVEFPSMSYYPTLQQTTSTPYEVVWRAWEELTESAHKLSASQDVLDFTVMSYNILAQDLLEANQKLYSHCPLEVLQWSYRYQHLTEDIQKWAPDILCLQEVQEDHYKEQLHPFLSQMGYSCVYKRRTGTKTDGCATCYRGDVFSELSVKLLEFYRPETGLLNQDNVGIVLLLQPVASSTRGSEVKAKGPLLCVANTHLLFNPRRGDVKLTQLAIVLAEISRVVRFCKDRGDHCNVILCGDFNSVPHTPLYQLITNGQLFYHGLPSWMISGQEDLSYRAHHQHRLFAPLLPSSLGITDNCQYTTDKDKFKRGTQESGKLRYDHDFLLQLRFCAAACVRPLDLDQIDCVTDNTPDASRENQQQCVCIERFGHSICHGLTLHSAYKHILPGSGRPEITTLHSDVGDTVDYIFYSPKCTDSTAGGHTGDSHLAGAGLKMIGYLPLLSEDVLWSMKGLPNEVFPSDHLSLLAKFQMELLPA